MAIYHVDTVFPTTGAAPTNEYSSGVHYTSWETDDEVRFNYIVPSTFDNDAAELLLKIEDSTPETTLNHAWEATIYLLRPTLDNPLSPTIYSVRSSDFTPPSTASQLTLRTLTLTDDGTIGGDGGSATEISAGDTLSIVLKRIAPTVGSDDSNEIKVISMAITFSVEGEPISACGGRTGLIISEVKVMFQDSGVDDAWLSDAIVLKWVNQCYRSIARKGVFRKTWTLTPVSGTAAYVITDEDADTLNIQNVRATDTSIYLTKLHSRKQYDYLIQLAESGTPLYWLVDGNNLLLGPAPDSTDTLTVTATYMPDEMDCVTYTNPITPPAHDEVYINYCLYRAFMREERDATRTKSMSQDYFQLYKDQLDDLVSSYTPSGVSRRPG